MSSINNRRPKTVKYSSSSLTKLIERFNDGDEGKESRAKSSSPTCPAASSKTMDLKKEYNRYCKLYSSEPLDIIGTPLEKANCENENVTVDLKGRGLRSVDCIALGKILASDSAITHLNLSDCLLLPQGFQVLMENLSKNTKLMTLELKGNNIQGTMITSLAKFLKLNNTLKRLILEWNRLGAVKDLFIMFCEAMSLNSSIEYLDLRNNQIGHEVASELGTLLRKNESLKEFDLRWNSIGLIGAKAIWDSLRINFTISKIHLSGNFIPDDIVNYIDQCLEKHNERESMMKNYAIRTSTLTRQLQKTEENFEKEIGKMASNFAEEEHELKSNLTVQREKITHLQDKLSNEISNSQSLSLQIERLNANLLCSKEKEETLQRALEIKEEHSEQMENLYKSEISKLKDGYESKLQLIEEDNDNQEKDVQSAIFKIRKLESHIEIKNSEIASLNERIEVMSKCTIETKENFEERIQAEREKWTNWKCEIETSEKREIRKLENQIKDMQAGLMDHIKALEKSKAEAEEESRHIKVMLVKNKTEAEEELTRARISLKSEHEKLTNLHNDEKSELKEKIKLMESQIQNLSSSLRKFESENNKFERQNENFRQQIANLDQELINKDSQIHSAVQRARNEVKEQIEQLSKEEEANKILRTKVLEIQEQMAKITLKHSREIQEKFSESEHWKTQVERREIELTRLKEEDMRRASLLLEAFLAYMRSTSAATGLPLPSSYYNGLGESQGKDNKKLESGDHDSNNILTKESKPKKES